MHPRLVPLSALLAPSRPVVFMDCDGIIFDTNRSKCDAFRHALAGYPHDVVEALVAHHMATGGVSRYVKLKRFFDQLHPVADPEAAVRQALERFGAYSEAAYAELRPRPESLVFAEYLGGNRSVHVISGSDGDELRRVFRSQGLDSHFASVCGSPATKIDHMQRILTDVGAEPGACLFVGDGGGDWQAAQALGMPFLLLGEMSEWRDGPATLTRACDADPAEEATFAVAIAASWQMILDALPPHR
jgi:phosphoglycolate phosphatase-like HAD superfamily hydrolase